MIAGDLDIADRLALDLFAVDDRGTGMAPKYSDWASASSARVLPASVN